MILTHVSISTYLLINLHSFWFSFSQVPIIQTLRDLRKRRSLALYSWVVLECVRGKKEESEANEREEEEGEGGAAAVWVDWVLQALAVAATPRVHLPCQIVRRGPDLHLHQPLIFMMTWTKRITHTQTPPWSVHWIVYLFFFPLLFQSRICVCICVMCSWIVGFKLTCRWCKCTIACPD